MTEITLPAEADTGAHIHRLRRLAVKAGALADDLVLVGGLDVARDRDRGQRTRPSATPTRPPAAARSTAPANG